MKEMNKEDTKILNELVEKYMPNRYYGYEARRYARVIAQEYALHHTKCEECKKRKGCNTPDDYACRLAVNGCSQSGCAYYY